MPAPDLSAWVFRSSGLVAEIELPRLTMAEAIERGWRPRDGGRMLEPIPPVYLHTRPWVSPTARWGYR